mgnify:CR=1 FL=1
MAGQVETTEPVGKSVPRIDAYEKVTGAVQYVDDIPFGPNLLYGKFVRSPYAHALIKSINCLLYTSPSPRDS